MTALSYGSFAGSSQKLLTIKLEDQKLREIPRYGSEWSVCDIKRNQNFVFYRTMHSVVPIVDEHLFLVYARR